MGGECTRRGWPQYGFVDRRSNPSGQPLPRVTRRGTLAATTSADLKPAQVEALFATVDRHRRYAERVYARCLELGFPENDPFRMEARPAVLAYRKEGRSRAWQSAHRAAGRAD